MPSNPEPPPHEADAPADGDRTAVGLCLAGGGLSGALFEFGAVAALEAGIPGWSPVRSRGIVGTSCGAMVGAVLAMGAAPEEALLALGAGRKHPIHLRRTDVARLLWRGHLGAVARSLVSLPRLLRGHSRGGRVHWEEVTEELRPNFPSGFFTNAGLTDLLARTARRQGRGDRFEDLPVPLAVTATDLDTGERVVYGPGFTEAVSLSLAVRASTAIPVYYEPVRIDGRDLIDGQIVDPLHLDLAVRPGTKAVLAVNPLVPYHPRGEGDHRTPRVREVGAAAVMDQSGRISARIKQQRSWEDFRRSFPEVECLLVQPRPEVMIELLRAGHGQRGLARVWRLGFRVAARELEGEEASRVLSPLGLPVDRDRLREAGARWGVEPAP